MQQKKSRNNRTIKKQPAQKKEVSNNDGDKKKINYVLNPKKIKERITEVKEMERREKEKSYQTQSERYYALAKRF